MASPTAISGGNEVAGLDRGAHGVGQHDEREISADVRHLVAARAFNDERHVHNEDGCDQHAEHDADCGRKDVRFAAFSLVAFHGCPFRGKRAQQSGVFADKQCAEKQVFHVRELRGSISSGKQVSHLQTPPIS